MKIFVREIRKMYLFLSKSLLLLSYYIGVMFFYVFYILGWYLFFVNVIYMYVIIEVKGECRKDVICFGKFM